MSKYNSANKIYNLPVNKLVAKQKWREKNEKKKLETAMGQRNVCGSCMEQQRKDKNICQIGSKCPNSRWSQFRLGNSEMCKKFLCVIIAEFCYWNSSNNVLWPGRRHWHQNDCAYLLFLYGRVVLTQFFCFGRLSTNTVVLILCF